MGYPKVDPTLQKELLVSSRNHIFPVVSKISIIWAQFEAYISLIPTVY